MILFSWLGKRGGRSLGSLNCVLVVYKKKIIFFFEIYLPLRYNTKLKFNSKKNRASNFFENRASNFFFKVEHQILKIERKKNSKKKKNYNNSTY